VNISAWWYFISVDFRDINRYRNKIGSRIKMVESKVLAYSIMRRYIRVEKEK